MKTMKKGIVLLFALLLCVGLLSVGVFAGAEDLVTSGSAGDNVTWTLTENVTSGKYTLTFSGSGAIKNYESSSDKWLAQKENIDTVIVGEGITALGANFIRDTTNVALSLPSTLEATGITITSGGGAASFGNDKGIASITITNNSNFVVDNGVLFTADKTTLIKYSNAAGENYTVPDSVKTINARAFAKNTFVKSVTLLEGLETIGAYAFQECSGLTSVDIPASVTAISGYAFDKCSSLKSVVVNGSVIGTWMFSNCTSLESVEVKGAMSKFPEAVFKGDKALKNVTLNFTADADYNYSTGNAQFANCDALESVTISGLGGTFPSSWVNSQKNLTSLTFNNVSFTAIEGGALRNTALETVDLTGAKLSSIGDYTFQDNHQLKTVVFGVGNNFTKGSALFGSDSKNSTNLLEKVIVGFDSVEQAEQFTSFSNETYARDKLVKIVTNGADFSGALTAEYDLNNDYTREGDYIFGGWYTDKDLTEANKVATMDTTHQTYYAKWTPLYTVTFLDADGTKLWSGEVAEGKTPTAPADPTKAADAQYTYTFSGWDSEIGEVKENVTYQATYSRTINQYTVTYTGTGVTAQTSTVDYGTATPAYSGTPSYAGFIFAGWSPSVAPTVTGNATYTAQWIYYDPTPANTEPETDIPDEETPLAENPEEVEDIEEPGEDEEGEELDIEEETVPLAALPEGFEDEITVEIEGEEVPLAELPVPYEDVDDEGWIHDAAAYAYYNDIMIGTTEDGAIFAPDDASTGDMLAAMLYRVNGGEITTGEDWADDALAWAEENGIIEDIGFDPDANVTREQLVTMIYRLAENMGYDVSARSVLALDFTDADELSDYAQDAMSWAVSVGLVKGMGDGTVNGGGELTRAQIAAIFMRFDLMLAK